MKSLLFEAKNMQETLIEHRRYLHENAEVHMDLPITTAYVIEQLEKMGYEPKEICQSGILATVGKSSNGKTFLLRADMDALPIKEETDLPFKSKTNNMHACGHDLHTAMLLGAAKLLKDKATLQIIIITADEKTTKRVNKTISTGVSAFIQKPFTLDEVKKAIDVAESEYSLLQ